MNTDEHVVPSNEQTVSTFEVRPGAKFPDWSVATSELAQQALTDIIEAFGIEKCFTQYEPDEDRVRINVLRYLAGHGRAPTIDELAEATGLLKSEISEHLISLNKKDLVVLNEAMEQIIGAYPLTERETEHLVVIGNQQIHAMCAIDALGTGSMFKKDIQIKSFCRATRAPITIELTAGGTEIKSVDPESAIVWSGIQLSDGCAADSLCTVLAFFSSNPAFEDWRAREHPDTPGYRLTLDEGLQVGRAIFDPFLANTDA